jgi:hypothetical protein
MQQRRKIWSKLLPSDSLESIDDGQVLISDDILAAQLRTSSIMIFNDTVSSLPSNRRTATTSCHNASCEAAHEKTHKTPTTF